MLGEGGGGDMVITKDGSCWTVFIIEKQVGCP